MGVHSLPEPIKKNNPEMGLFRAGDGITSQRIPPLYKQSDGSAQPPRAYKKTTPKWDCLERAMGFEPTTFSLARRHSTN